jgi:hypothetical protein
MLGAVEPFSELAQRDGGKKQFGIRRPLQESVCGAVVVSSGSFPLQINEKRCVNAQPARH